MNASVTHIQCVVCEGNLPGDRNLGSMYCGLPCERVAGRAKRYGTTTAQMLALTAPGATCDICGSDKPDHVDHDHSTGTVRGYLCGQCNVGLGMFKDSADSLRGAIRYLERAQEFGELEWLNAA